MPLLDHFHPPLAPDHHWESFQSNWATRIADALNEQWLPPEFIAEEFTHAGSRLEIDVATFEMSAAEQSAGAGNGREPTTTAVAAAPAWAPPRPLLTMPAVFPESFEVRIYQTTSGRTLVAAIELVSPANKDRPEQRRAFAAKCASYLGQGISLVVMDVVTNRKANLHNEVIHLLEADDRFLLDHRGCLYAVSYRPVERDGRQEVDLWLETIGIGDALPTLPLRLTGDLFVPVEFESTYQEACRRRRLI